MVNNTKTAAYKAYAARYLRHCYDLGFPAEKDRLKFQGNFLKNNPRGPGYGRVDKSPLKNVLWHFLRSLQKGQIPEWTKDNPSLLSMWNKVANDYKEKNGNGGSDATQNNANRSTLKQQKQENTNDWETTISSDECDQSYGNDTSLMNDQEGNRVLDTKMIFQLQSQANSYKNPRGARTPKGNCIVPMPRTTPPIDVKEEEVEDGPIYPDSMTLPPLETRDEPLAEKIRQLENQNEQQDIMIDEWRKKYYDLEKKCEEERKKLTTKIAQLEEEHKAEKMKMMDEKLKVMNQLVEEKDRTIKLLSY